MKLQTSEYDNSCSLEGKKQKICVPQISRPCMNNETLWRIQDVIEGKLNLDLELAVEHLLVKRRPGNLEA